MCSQPKEEPEDSSPGDDPGDDVASTADIQDPAHYKEVFKPNKRLGEWALHLQMSRAHIQLFTVFLVDREPPSR